MIAERVYSIIKKIPKGKVATYKQIASLAGNIHPRYIGYLLHHNPDPKTIPCHRVVSSQGKLAKQYAFGGIAGQKRRLIDDGLVLNGDTVSLKKYQWSRYV